MRRIVVVVVLSSLLCGCVRIHRLESEPRAAGVEAGRVSAALAARIQKAGRGRSVRIRTTDGREFRGGELELGAWEARWKDALGEVRSLPLQSVAWIEFGATHRGKRAVTGAMVGMLAGAGAAMLGDDGCAPGESFCEDVTDAFRPLAAVYLGTVLGGLGGVLGYSLGKQRERFVLSAPQADGE